MKTTLYLAYGSNLNRRQMARRCPTAKVVGAATLNGYRLLFRGAPCGAVATIEPCAGASVPCLLWRLQPADEAALDRYEGFPNFYRKEMLAAKRGSETIQAMAYVMNEGHSLGMPSKAYFWTIADAYHDLGMPTDVLLKALGESKK